MKIVSLTAENVKRLKAVRIEPDGTLQVISGRNAQGKSSVLEAMWLALGGGAASREMARPVRDGADEAFVELDLGDVVVTRRWKGGKSTLEVARADGGKLSGPQTFLDSLVGRLSFDPLEFTRLSAREQVEALLGLVDLGIDLDALAAERRALYDQRAAVGRQVKAIGDVTVDPGLPVAETSAADLIAQIREGEAANRAVDTAAVEVSRLTDRIEALERELSDARFDLAVAEKAAAGVRVDVSVLETQLAEVEETNAAVRANNTARAEKERKDALVAEYAALGEQIAALDEKKTNALAAAKFPVDGLGFDDDGVTYQGVPFSQASSAEQIRVSLAMAMALNPKLRVIRILDGSLLDADSMRLIGEMAGAAGYQVWVERVGDDGSGVVVIEDGEVAA